MEPAIVIEGLSKHYMIGHRIDPRTRSGQATLRESITRGVHNVARKTVDVLRGREVVQGDEVEKFWALRDISFSVSRGEVLGVIGRNGAGKSTLLKILSRIMEPTEGRVLLRGRVSSLLEVGTGFHAELTGRENIFLNGAVLGMTQREIKKKFDEIVAFSGVDKFLDTPVKRYSSGMYVRLAFSVAAHLEPEILIVDEVLAVGDVEFQKKCLGKMDEVSRSHGRTVLFVSHNMDAVLKLCQRAVFLESGRTHAIGGVNELVTAYLSSQSSSPRAVDLTTKSRIRPAFYTGQARLMEIKPSHPDATWSMPFGTTLSLDLTIDAVAVTTFDIIIGIYSSRGFEVASWTNKSSGIALDIRPGKNTFRIQYEHLRLLPGQYSLGLGIIGERGYEDGINEAVTFEVISSPEAVKIDAYHFGGAMVACATVSTVS